MLSSGPVRTLVSAMGASAYHEVGEFPNSWGTYLDTLPFSLATQIGMWRKP